MKLYAQIVDEKTKKLAVGLGTNTAFYESVGMVEMEVERAYDGQWYVKGYAPEKPALTEAEIQEQLKKIVENQMDVKAQEKGYDDILAACSYATSTDHIFAAEGIACVKWRDAVWRKYIGVLAEIKEGKRDVPTEEELLAELPVLEW